MFSKFELIVGVRYLYAKHQNKFISFISFISIIGIALGVAVLIIVLSVMNGFQRDIRAKIIGATAHMQLTDSSGLLNNYSQIASTVMQHNSHILGYAPYVDGQALLSFDNNVNGVLLRGVDPQFETHVDNINQFMQHGSLSSLKPGTFNIVIGQTLAEQLGVTIGQKIMLITPDGQITPTGMIPRLKEFTVSGIFNLHMNEYDTSLVLINLHDAQILLKMNNNVSGIRLKVDDVMQTTQIKEQLALLEPNLIISDWIDQHQSYFNAVLLEKRMMSLVLFLIVTVATFNLVSTLVMSVKEKAADIAILSTMGASRRSIMLIFMLQGTISGIIGTMCGVLLGLIGAINAGKIVHSIELITHSKLIRDDVYLIDYLPSQVIPHDVIMIALFAIILSIVATIYPSISASKLEPVETLRYE
jgi:lipoprotein-releasing system permease protein